MSRTGVVHFAGRAATVNAATLEVFHLYSRRPGWVLDAELAGSVPRLWLAGTANDAWPRRLDVEYVDAPAVVVVDGRPGALTIVASDLVASELGAGLARIAGTLALRWTGGDADQPYDVTVELVAALVT